MTNLTLVLVYYFLIPVMLTVLSGIAYKFPPTKRNWWYGYRTFLSMRSEESFEYAQDTFTPPALCMGIISTLMSLVLVLYNNNNPAHLEAVGTMLFTLYAAALLALIVSTELVLYHRFSKQSKT